MTYGIAYLIGYVLFLRPVFRFLRDDIDYADDDDAALFLAANMALAFLVASVWPLIALGMAFRYAVAGRERNPAVIARKLGGETREQKRARRERERNRDLRSV